MNLDTEMPESTSPSPEERLESFANLVRDAERQKGLWTSQVHRLLDEYLQFLEEKPTPPESWTKRLGSQVEKYEYHQIVLPEDYLDPYLDEIGNLQLLKEKFSGSLGFMALESFLVTRNHFLFGNGHLKPIEIPRPIAMFESIPDSKEIPWDCTLSVFSDGSWVSYNMDREEEESMGEGISEHLERWLPLLGHMRVVIPQEGQDYGVFGPVKNDSNV